MSENLVVGKIEQLSNASPVDFYSLSEVVFEGGHDIELSEPNFVFHSEEVGEILRLEPNGDIFVKGKLIENDKEVLPALREFLKL